MCMSPAPAISLMITKPEDITQQVTRDFRSKMLTVLKAQTTMPSVSSICLAVITETQFLCVFVGYVFRFLVNCIFCQTLSRYQKYSVSGCNLAVEVNIALNMTASVPPINKFISEVGMYFSFI